MECQPRSLQNPWCIWLIVWHGSRTTERPVQRVDYKLNTYGQCRVFLITTLGSICAYQSVQREHLTRRCLSYNKEELTFASALACAAAHADPKSGRSEESTFERWLGRVTFNERSRSCSARWLTDGGRLGSTAGYIEDLGISDGTGKGKKEAEGTGANIGPVETEPWVADALADKSATHSGKACIVLHKRMEPSVQFT